MAKPTTTSTKEQGSPPAAPAQPWAPAQPTPPAAPAQGAESQANASGGNGGGVDPPSVPESAGNAAPAAQTTVTSPTEIPASNVSDIPGAQDAADLDVSGTHAQAERLAEHDVSLTKPGTELPSAARDQFSPSGVDIALEADRSERPSLERSAFPSVGERVHQMLAGASDEVRDAFEDGMLAYAEKLITELRKDDASAQFNARLVEPGTHYGPGVRSDAAKAAASRNDAGSNAERNRRARRAAERLAQQTRK